MFKIKDIRPWRQKQQFLPTWPHSLKLQWRAVLLCTN